MSYKHLSIDEREKILFYLASGLSLCKIAQRRGRNKSTISRELCRNDEAYSPSKAQINYQLRRKKSCPRKKLDNPQLFDIVRRLFLEEHLSPEQIAGRLKWEAYPIQLSFNTIIVGFNRKSALLTLVDMKSLFRLCCKLENLDSNTLAQAMTKLLRENRRGKFGFHSRCISFDNSREIKASACADNPLGLFV